jgi:hypothetical protein
MPLTIDQLKSAYQKADENQDSFLNFEELKAALADLQLAPKDAQLHAFLTRTIHLNKTPAVDFQEFVLLVRLLESPVKHIDSLFSYLPASTHFAHIIAKDGVTGHDPHAEVKIRLADSEAVDVQFPTSIGLYGGPLHHVQGLQTNLGKGTDAQVALVINVHVQDPEAIVGAIRENLEAFKMVLSEVSTEVKNVLDGITFDVVATPHGIQIVLDLSKEPVIEAWAGVLEKPFELFEATPHPVWCRLETTADVEHLEQPLVALAKEATNFEFVAKNFSGKKLFQSEGLKSILKKELERPDIFALYALVCSLKKVNLDITFDHQSKAEAIASLGPNVSSQAPNKLIDQLVKDMDAASASDFLELFDNAREILRILHNNNASSGGLFLKLHHVYFGVQVRASLWPVFSKLLKLE